MVSSNCKFHEILLIFSWPFDFVFALSVDEMCQKHIEQFFFCKWNEIIFLEFEGESPLVCLVVLNGFQSCENKKVCSADVFFWHSLSMLLIVVLSVFCPTLKAEVNVMLPNQIFVNKETTFKLQFWNIFYLDY